MRHMTNRAAGVVVWGVAVAIAASGCSTSHKASSSDLSALANAAGGGGAQNSAGAGASDSAAGNSPASDSGEPILGDNPGCHMLSASDIKTAVGKDLPSLLGNVGGGQAGNTGHQSCTYTGDSTGKGADVNLEIDTFVGTAKDQLATLRKSFQDQADSQNQFASGSAVLKDVSIGDGGFEFDVHATSGYDETVWFVKGDKLASVEVGGGNPGGAANLAQEVAGKI
jgi:hypothetical protein